MDATATLLADGKVLIAGGNPYETVSTPPVLASAELYDPATGKFTPTGSMSTARADATATLLPDGRVLIAGGWGCRNVKTCSPDDTTQGSGAVASAELYDPTSGKFSSTGSMSTPRCAATATPLPDGRVLLLNGADSRQAEVYDPTSGKFAPTGSLLNDYSGGYGSGGVTCGNATATLLANGKVLVTGDDASGRGPSAELFDPASGKSTAISLVLPTGAVTTVNGYLDVGGPETATLLKDGHVLLCVMDYLVTYDSATGSFTQSGSISAPSAWLLATPTLLPDGRVLFAGGYLDPDVNTEVVAATAGLYDPGNGFHLIGSMNAARGHQTATLLPDGTVLIAGGIDQQGNGVSSAELFRP